MNWGMERHVEKRMRTWRRRCGIAAGLVFLVVVWAGYRIVSIDYHMRHTINAGEGGWYWTTKTLAFLYSLAAGGSVLIVVLLLHIVVLEQLKRA